MTTEDTLEFYLKPGPLTSAGPHEAALRALPDTLPELLEAVQGILIHAHLTWAYDLEPTPEHEFTTHLRPAEHIIGRLLADGRPITESREPAERVAGTCRDFSVITVAALRAHGIPARARCGFGRYFEPDWYIDHWVAEYWDATASRWVLTDAQIDSTLRNKLDIGIDTHDVARDQFVVAGDAWLGYRAGEVDPARCGLPGEGQSGWWWIAGNLVRDVAALSGMELLPWDVWGAMPEDKPEPAELVELLDELAATTADPDTAADVRERYENDDRIRVPEQVFNFVRQREEPVIAGS